MSHVRRVVHIRVLVVARSGPVRAATLGAFACDRGISVVGAGATSPTSALVEVERWRPDVVVIDATTLSAAADLSAQLVGIARGAFELPPATVLVTSRRGGDLRGPIVVQARDGSDDELLDYQGEVLGAVWSAAASRSRLAAGADR